MKKYLVLRGGSWDDLRVYARCACRYVDHPDDRNDYLGFRLAKDDSSYRVRRGGSWSSSPIILRSAYRCWFVPGHCRSYQGFRLAK